MSIAVNYVDIEDGYTSWLHAVSSAGLGGLPRSLNLGSLNLGNLPLVQVAMMSLISPHLSSSCLYIYVLSVLQIHFWKFRYYLSPLLKSIL
jgi:hypothetical protein